MTENNSIIHDTSLSDHQISKFSTEYKKRRKQQMLRFFGATAVTLLSCRMAYRGIKSRRYIPHMFQLNYKHPPISYQGEAVNALLMGTGLATGGFAMIVLGASWIWDISTPKELSFKIRELMGEKPQELQSTITNMPLDEDTAEVVSKLEELLSKK